MKARNKDTMNVPMIEAPNTLEHCIFCLRKISTNPSYRKAVISSSSGNEKLTVVPHAIICSSTDLLTTLNLIWPHMQSNQVRVGSTGTKQLGITMSEVMNGLEVKVASHSVLPAICQLCANEVLQVEGLLKAVRCKVNTLRRIITESKRDGLYSWRMAEYEQNLKQAGLSEEEIRANSRYWDYIGDQLEKRSSTSMAREKDADDDDAKAMDRDAGTKTEVKDEPVFDSDEDSHGGIEQFAIDQKCQNYNYDKEETSGEDAEEDGILSAAESVEELLLHKEAEEVSMVDNSDSPPSHILAGGGGSGNGADKQVNLNGDLFNSSWEYLCPEEGCGKSFTLKRGLTKHQKLDHPEKSDCACPCGKVFALPSKMRQHRKICSPRNALRRAVGGAVVAQRCDMCKAPVRFKDILAHIRNHVGDYALKCPNNPCPYVFSNSEPIPMHINNVCSFNPKRKVRGLSLKPSDGTPPKRIINRDYLYTCQECGYESYKRQVFRTHVQANHERISHLNHPCPIAGCNAMFTVRQSVDFHLSIHKLWKNSTQKCELCSESFKPEKMADHLTRVHKHQDLFPCPHCPFTLSARTYYVEHLYDHRHLGFFCDICGRDVKFSKHNDLRQHYQTEHNVKFTQLSCELCGNVLSTREKLRTHVRTQHPAAGDSNADCDVDVASTDSRMRPDGDTNRRHKVENSVKKPPPKKYPCDLCLDPPMSFATIGNLCSHKIQLHGMEPFQCKTCGKQFSYRANLASHEKTEHEGMKKESSCPEPGCGKVFDTERKLKRHLYKTHREKNRICAECGKAYSTSQSLRIHHDTVHLGLRSEVCEICGEAFTSSTVLKRHKLIHTGERPFECNLCGQKFRHNEVLRRHVKSHVEKGDSFKPNGPMKQIRKRKGQN